MTGLTLLNIDRALESSKEPLHEIEVIVDEINQFISKMPADTMTVRLTPLKLKLNSLQDYISQFGSDGTLQVNEKQRIIMQLHMELGMLGNKLLKYDGQYADITEICSNYLLNHLCSSAAVDPRATVIGVSNVMAQVLSKDIQIKPKPKLDVTFRDPKYFEHFSLHYNQMLTIAGLFSAPVLGLPDIPISQLGSWGDQALSQFAEVYNFIDESYNPQSFYKIEKEMKAVPFDASADILSFYIYLNEFFVALIARADLLSGIEFPGEFTSTNESIVLQSAKQVNEVLSASIEVNCDKIIDHLDKMDELFKDGIIDRNEDPAKNSNLSKYRVEVKIWRTISKLAKLIQYIVDEEIDKIDDIELLQRDEYLNYINSILDAPPYSKESSNLEIDLLNTLLVLIEQIADFFPESVAIEVDDFITSSDFTKYRQFLQYAIHIVAAHDIFVTKDYQWLSWMNAKFGKFYLEGSTAYNPIGALEIGILSVMSGITHHREVLIQDGVSILQNSKKYLEFQLHNYFAIDVILKIISIGINNVKEKSDMLINFLTEFLKNFEVSPNSLLFQRTQLYVGMLGIHGSSDVSEEMQKLTPEQRELQDPFIMMRNRAVSFDPFSWLLVSNSFRPIFAYIPLNTSLANLNSG